MPRLPKLFQIALALLIVLPFTARGQDMLQPVPASSYAPEQIDQMVAPIALYPDELVSQILMAATYPLEVVEASRWLQNPQNAQLRGDQLDDALQQEPWDPSVKSLVNFPSTLAMMDKNIQWTEHLGEAFLTQQADVMNSVQQLRQMAQNSGHLTSTAQQIVSQDQGVIEIAPANPQVVYVPYYNPTVVYGAWPYAAYQPYYFVPPYGYGYVTTGVISFGVGFGVVAGLWGWDHWDWRHHRIDIDDGRYAEINRGQPPIHDGVWEHDPVHRHGVPYAAPIARQKFQAENTNETRRNFRGFAPAGQAQQRTSNAVPIGYHTANVVQHAPAVASAPVQNFQRQQPAQAVQRPTQAVQNVPRQYVQRSQPVAQAPQARTVPAFESYSRGTEARAQSQRGAYSRASAPAPIAMHAAAPRAAAPAPRADPSGGGSHGGNGRNDTRH